MRTSTYQIKRDRCPHYVRVEVADPTFVTKAGEWVSAMAERIGWTLQTGRIRCGVCGGVE
jgi:hypothetical protein